VIEVAGAPAPPEEVAAILAALAAVEPNQADAPRSGASPWKMAGRNYDPQDGRCSARF